MAAADTAPWWFGARKRIFLDFHMPEHGSQAPAGVPVAFSDLDTARIVRQVAGTGADVLVFFARDNQGNSHYPTRLGHPLADLGGRDMVAEFIEALRPHGIRAVAYFQPIRDRRLWELHPEFRQINNDGTERVPQAWLQQGKGGHRVICPLGPAAEVVFAELEELVTRYRLDGVWWDRVGDVFGPDERFPCFCESCQAAFRAAAGMDIPRSVDWDSPAWRTYYAWRADALLAFQQRARERVAASGACLISNYAFHGMVMADPFPLSVDWEAIAAATDVMSLEMQHMRSYFHVSSHPMLARALTDGPVEIIMWNNRFIGDGFVRSIAGAEVAAHTALARGHAIVFHDTVDHDGRADPELFALARHVFDRLAPVMGRSAEAMPLRHVAVLFSPATYTWHGRGQPVHYVQEFMGSLRQVVGLHLPAEVICDRHLTPAALASYRMLVLPMAACIDAAAAQAIDAWVAAGGVLVATHETAGRDAAGRPGESALQAVLGVRVTETVEAGAAWMRAVPGAGLDGQWGARQVALRGSYVKVAPLADTRVVAEIGRSLPGMDTFAHFIGPPGEWGPDPAVTWHRHGDGHAFFVAPAFGAMDLAYGIAELSGVLRLAASQAPPARAAVNAPDCIEAIFQQERDGTLLVHLTNLQGEVRRTHRMAGLPDGTRGIGAVLPVHDVEIRVDAPVLRARELLDDMDLEVTPAGAGSVIVLPRLDAVASVELVMD